jgi:transcriptional regulator with XRE-family HTH domain
MRRFFEIYVPFDRRPAFVSCCLALRLKAFQMRAGLTQADLAKLTGLADITLSRYETGAKEASWSSLVKVIQVLGVELVPLGLAENAASVPDVPGVGGRAIRAMERCGSQDCPMAS